MKKSNLNFKLLISIIFVLATLLRADFIFAETAAEIKDKIEERNNSIKKLEAEIQKYQADIDALGQEKNTLNNAIKSLDVSKKKLITDTKVTENKITSKNLEIQQLSLQIGDKNERITDGKRVIAQSLYNISQMNSASVLETLLGKPSFSSLWNAEDQLVILQSNMQDKIKDLAQLKSDLENNKKKTESKKIELLNLKKDLKSQTEIIAQTTKEKSAILQETKNTEANYKDMLATIQAQKEAYEREVSEFESALRFSANPNNIPTSGTGILNYPLKNIRITQYFGNTSFSTKNPRLYVGGSHNGVDFAASIGTPVMTALSGVVVGTGNTDLARGCKSYGKWIMVKHPNGLSTLYGHLSLISVTQGQNVSTGDVIGYSGKTGLSTGPHLHFGVYETDGVNITKNPSSKYCSSVLIPYANPKAYLNPLSYL